MALVHTWLAFEKLEQGFNEAQARQFLNEHLGTTYNHVQVAKWKKGVSPRSQTRQFMLQRCLLFAIEQYPGRTKKQLAELVEALL